MNTKPQLTHYGLLWGIAIIFVAIWGILSYISYLRGNPSYEFESHSEIQYVDIAEAQMQEHADHFNYTH